MPEKPVYEEVREWYAPSIQQMQAELSEHDLVFIGAVEGPFTDTYSYMDMQLFCLGLYEAPELVSHIMDCCGLFSAYIAQVYAEVSQVPLLFMGEEYGETAPFPFFCSYGDAELIESVRRGRREEFIGLEFQWGSEIRDPQAEKTFQSAKLQWAWPDGSPQAALRRLYQDFLTARRTWPALRDREHTRAGTLSSPGGEDKPGILVIERGEEERIVAYANLGPVAAPFAATPPEAGPFLEGEGTERRTIVLSTEDRRYGGERVAGSRPDKILPYELLVFGDRQWRLPTT